MSKIIVTGAAGFIGSHLSEALLRRGDTVIGVDNFDEFYDPAIKRRNLTEASKHAEFKLLTADIRDADAMTDLFRREKADAVIHMAARAGVRPSIEQPVLYQDVNVAGTQVLLEAARRVKTQRFVFASSSSVYGNNEKIPFSEEDRVDHPISPYAATKKAGELLAHTYHYLYGIDIACVRLFTAYGPRQRPDLAIHKFARLILKGEPIPVFGDGTTSRDYTYVDDIVSGILCALDRNRGYRIYNLGESDPVRLCDLIAALEAALGRKAVIDRRPMQPGDVERTYADVSRAKAELGYNPVTDLATGLKHFAQWLHGSL